MIDDPKVDAFEKRLRFGCGFILGGIASLAALLVIARWISIAGLLVIAHWLNDFSAPIGLAMLGTAILCGFLAMRYGDAFWYAVLRATAWIFRGF